MVPEPSKRLCLMKKSYKLGAAKLPYHFEFNFLIHKVSILVEIRVHKLKRLQEPAGTLNDWRGVGLGVSSSTTGSDRD